MNFCILCDTERVTAKGTMCPSCVTVVALRGAETRESPSAAEKLL